MGSMENLAELVNCPVEDGKPVQRLIQVCPSQQNVLQIVILTLVLYPLYFPFLPTLLIQASTNHVPAIRI